MPTFPVTVTANASIESNFNNVAPILAGTTRYLPMNDFSTPSVCIFSSTDSGATWNRINQAGEPIVDNTEGGFASAFDGTRIWIYSYNTGRTNSQITAFNTSTNLWEVTTVLTIQAGSGNQLGMRFRVATGELVCLGNFASLANAGFQRAGYFLFNTTTLTAASLIPCGFIGAQTNDWLASQVVQGNAMMHLLYFVTPQVTGGTRSIVQQALSNANALGGLQTIDSFTDASGLSTPANFRGDGDGTNVSVVWQPVSFGTTVNVFQGASAITITFTPFTLTLTDTNFDTIAIIINTHQNATFVVTTTDDGTNGYLNNATNSGSGYGTGFQRLYSFPADIVGNVNANNLGTLAAWGAIVTGTIFYVEFTGSGPSPGGSGATALINMSQAVVINLPDPRIYCIDSNRLLNRQSGGCKLLYPLQIGKIHEQHSYPFEPAKLGSCPDTEQLHPNGGSESGTVIA
jgi:hypothetical protein